ncbi:Hypothetical predicted protein [Marmota monax]|uniref:Clarin 1 n=1 Tax=Marmota monax TaxID=9995 RepID=A0A5E4BXR1_MARMO|nr:Hypothetical predicted protein [Marmota monax]
MPNQQKKIIFCAAGVLSFVCALGVVTALGTPLWIKATILCKTGALLVNASGQELDKFRGEMQYGLFHGQGVRQCGLGARPFRFSLLPADRSISFNYNRALPCERAKLCWESFCLIYSGGFSSTVGQWFIF